MRSAERPRHYVSGFALAILRPFFRYSTTRDAYVLRGMGSRFGPVLVRDRRPTKDSEEEEAGQQDPLIR